MALLERHEHRVSTFVVENNDVISERPRASELLRLARNAIWSTTNAARITSRIRRDRP